MGKYSDKKVERAIREFLDGRGCPSMIELKNFYVICEGEGDCVKCWQAALMEKPSINDRPEV